MGPPGPTQGSVSFGDPAPPHSSTQYLRHIGLSPGPRAQVLGAVSSKMKGVTGTSSALPQEPAPTGLALPSLLLPEPSPTSAYSRTTSPLPAVLSDRATGLQTSGTATPTSPTPAPRHGLTRPTAGEEESWFVGGTPARPGGRCRAQTMLARSARYPPSTGLWPRG